MEEGGEWQWRHRLGGHALNLKVKRFLRGYQATLCCGAAALAFKDRSLVSPSQKCETTPDACGVRHGMKPLPNCEVFSSSSLIKPLAQTGVLLLGW